MMPSIELRLETMTRALHEVILPAIADDNALAREQARLLIAHLDLFKLQWRDAHTYDVLALGAMTKLAERLASYAEGGTRCVAAAAALTQCLASVADDAARPALRRAALAAAIDELIAAACEDGSAVCRQMVFDEIIAHAERETLRDRAWFAANGMDPERGTLPDAATLLDTFDA